MKKRVNPAALAIFFSSLLLSGCDGNETKTANSQPPAQANASNVQPPAAPKGTPLPDSAFKAVLSAVNPPATMNVGEQATLQVKLKNNSDANWPSVGDSDGKYQVKVGNHWLDQNSKPVVVNDGRTPLPADLKPGAEIELPLTITAPTKPGDYILQLDIVQENVAWSQDKGNTTFKARVKVK